jgi:hypothetical protein
MQGCAGAGAVDLGALAAWDGRWVLGRCGGPGSVRVTFRERAFRCVASGSARRGEVKKQETVGEEYECRNRELSNGRSPDVESSVPGRVVVHCRSRYEFWRGEGVDLWFGFF